MEPRDKDEYAQDMAIGAAVFHGYVLAKDTNGEYSGIAHDGEPFSGALTAQTYGIRSYAPANTGLVLTRSAAGLLVLSQEGSLPTGVSEPLSGETLLYNAQGAKIHLDTNGDINITQKSGRFVKIGTSPTQFAARADRVLSELENFQSTFDGHTHLVPAPISAQTGVPSALIVSVDDPACDEVKIK